MKYRRYAEYKVSGVEWLGEVPTHWETPLLKYVTTFNYGDSLAAEFRAEEGTVPVFGSNGMVGVHSTANTLAPAIIVGRKGSYGKVTYTPDKAFSIDTTFFVDATCTEQHLRWLYYALQAAGLDKVSQDTGVPGLSREAAYATRFVVPSLDEQQLIAAFLDRETVQIDALIAKQERLIAVLQEKRNALVPSDGSGVETTRIAHIADLILRPVVQQEGEVYIPIGLFNRGRGLFHKEPRTISEMGDSDFFWVKERDLIISGQFAWEGAVAFASPEEENCVVSHRYHVLRGKNGVVKTEYLLAFLSTRHGNFLLNENSRGAAGRNRPLNIDSLLKESIPIPPMNLQEEIACLVHKERQIKAKIDRQVGLLNERRMALITAAVTGKIDVRSQGS